MVDVLKLMVAEVEKLLVTCRYLCFSVFGNHHDSCIVHKYIKFAALLHELFRSLGDAVQAGKVTLKLDGQKHQHHHHFNHQPAIL